MGDIIAAAVIIGLFALLFYLRFTEPSEAERVDIEHRRALEALGRIHHHDET